MRSALVFLSAMWLAGACPLPSQGATNKPVRPGELIELPRGRVALGRVTAGYLRREGFTKGIEYRTPNGGSIWIVAQAGVADLAVRRAYNLLSFFLRPVAGVELGTEAVKSAVANAMGKNRAMLMMPTGAHREGREPEVPAQPLYEAETPIDGSSWYLDNDWDHRDAAFEEIFHLVHDEGIGTDSPGALPGYQKALDREARKAIKDGRWGIPVDEGVSEWLRELEDENSLAQEYIASVLDSYYGLWGAFKERPGGMWGIYCAKTRAEIGSSDRRGRQLLERFLPKYLVGYESLIAPTFEGTFSLQFDSKQPYTHKSQYLVEVTLTGDHASGVRGNDRDNVLMGNHGNNQLVGEGGTDTVRFSGPQKEYAVERSGTVHTVRDLIEGRDGIDTLISIEVLRFADGEVRL